MSSHLALPEHILAMRMPRAEPDGPRESVLSPPPPPPDAEGRGSDLAG